MFVVDFSSCLHQVNKLISVRIVNAQMDRNRSDLYGLFILIEYRFITSISITVHKTIYLMGNTLEGISCLPWITYNMFCNLHVSQKNW